MCITTNSKEKNFQQVHKQGANKCIPLRNVDPKAQHFSKKLFPVVADRTSEKVPASTPSMLLWKQHRHITALSSQDHISRMSPVPRLPPGFGFTDGELQRPQKEMEG